MVGRWNLYIIFLGAFGRILRATALKTNMTMEKQSFEDVSPIKHGDFSNVMSVFRGVNSMFSRNFSDCINYRYSINILSQVLALNSIVPNMLEESGTWGTIVQLHPGEDKLLNFRSSGSAGFQVSTVTRFHWTSISRRSTSVSTSAAMARFPRSRGKLASGARKGSSWLQTRHDYRWFFQRKHHENINYLLI